MKQGIKLATLLSVVTLLAACVSATPYRQAQSPRDYGYQEQKIEQNRYRVSFAGNSETDRQTVENYLLYRAAELTLEQGKDYFVITDSSTEKNVEQHSTVVGSPSLSFGYGHHSYRHHHGFGLGFNIISSSFNDYEAFGTIVLKSGKKPQDNDYAYDARQVVENLGKKVIGRELRKHSSAEGG